MKISCLEPDIFFTRLNFSSSIAITKLDILDVFDEVKIGVAYWIDDKKIDDSFPGMSWN